MIINKTTLAVEFALLSILLLGGHSLAADDLNDQHIKFLHNYCGDCHTGDSSEGGFDLEKLEKKLSEQAGFSKWERIYDRMDAHEMPPPEETQPPADLEQKFLASLKQKLTATHAANKSTILRRLNRQEYQNTLNDLFGVDLKIAELLPEDSRSHEFDNIGSALGISMVHLNKYLEAIRFVLDEAIAKSSAQPKINRIEGSYSNTREGTQFIGKIWKQLPDGAVVRFAGGGYPSGMIRSTGVRTPGRYRVKVTGYAYQSDKPITFSVGGTTFQRGAEIPTYGYFVFQPGQAQTIEFETRIESRYMIQIEPYGINDPDRYKRKTIDGYQGPGLAIKSVELEGPLNDQFPSRGHQLIFDGIQRTEIEPRDPRQKQKSWYKPKFEIASNDERGDASQSLLRVAAFAFRQRVSPKDIAPYLTLFESEREKGSTFEEALRHTVTAIFCSPRFLFLQENQGKLNDFAVASRLSYFLHRSMPDKTLLQSAASGKLLSEPGELIRQANRLMADRKFARFIEDFSDSWLNLREIDFTVPDSQLFPEYDQYLRYSMPLETHGYLREMIEANLPIRHLVKSDFAMINERLAKLYGIEQVTGPKVRKVKLPKDSVRGGLLSQASVLKVSANGTNTSPVVRGVWVMERILGLSPQPPPPGIPGVEPDIRGATTLRELLDKHRNLSNCQSCHQMIDPPGFALESFNPIGGYRDRYRSIGNGDRVNVQVNGRKVRYRLGPPVDSSGQLTSGSQFQDFNEYRELLVKDERALVRAFAKKLLTFGAGRELGFSDREEVEQIVDSIAKSGYKTRDLVHHVIQSRIFLNK